MQYHTVGHTNISVSEIGFGCSSMGGPNWSLQSGVAIGRSAIDQREILEGIRAGLDAGVTHFDNADVYGNGRAERMLRDCLAQLGVKRDRVVIATKVGHFQGTAAHAYEPHHIRRQCEQSLRNLGTDTIDIYYFHNPWFAPDDEQGNIHDAVGEMRKLVDEGKVRAVGQSAYSIEDFERVVPVVKPDVLQGWASMLQDEFIRPQSSMQMLMEEHGCSFVGFSPLGQGLLLDKFDPENPPKFDTGDIRAGKPKFSGEALRALNPKLAKIKQRFGSNADDLASAACRFVAAHPNVCSVIPGFRNESQARCNVRASTDEPMSDADMRFCREIFAE